ncbi:hypothetical protein [Rufibacter quisquiliarum]|uniref:Uncharacterized protein n=1 Tax=Rufibacter quisquiliarum TaxID=1549639 RepID=A0A839G9A8_9BACT|nr:hypothetical protein [Rufibacter quisquiliarum]MBA9076064.1 hypothetical protein [Rufibacter quisquiliarum]
MIRIPLWLRTGARRIVRWPFRSFKNFFVAGVSIWAVCRWGFGYITADEMLTALSLIIKLFGLV